MANRQLPHFGWLRQTPGRRHVASGMDKRAQAGGKTRQARVNQSSDLARPATVSCDVLSRLRSLEDHLGHAADRAAHARTAGSGPDRSPGHRQERTRSGAATRTGRSPADGASSCRAVDGGRASGPRRRARSEAPPQRWRAPSREGRWRSPVARGPRTAPDCSSGVALPGDDLVGFGHDVIETMPTVTGRLVAGILERPHEVRHLSIGLFQEADTSRDDLVAARVSPRGNSLHCEPVELGWERDAIHG